MKTLRLSDNSVIRFTKKREKQMQFKGNIDIDKAVFKLTFYAWESATSSYKLRISISNNFNYIEKVSVCKLVCIFYKVTSEHRKSSYSM